MPIPIRERYSRLLTALLISSTASIILFAIRVSLSGSYRYGFLVWNLFLAWLPLMFAAFLINTLHDRRWSNWLPVLMTFFWLGFLPNSFYIVSDFIHLRYTGEVSVLFDAVLFTSFAINGLLLGYISLAAVHLQMVKRMQSSVAHALVAAILVLSSFAIYLGRFLHWNTWDVLINPAGLVYDVSDRLINPGAYPSMLATTAIFFILLGSLYAVAYQLMILVSGEAAYARKR